jgi:cell division initiation protein
MELTPQLFRDVQFTERRGAYDKDEVHAFLARVGTAVGQMQERVREAQRRLEAAEDHIAKLEAAAREQQDADETLRRTLVLAQRTADAAIKEAQDEAEVIVAEARSKADDMIVQAEEAVRRDVGATRDKLQAEIRDLERHRDELHRRVELITDHLESERSRIQAELADLSAVLDDPERLVVARVPGSDPEPVIVLTESAPAEVDDPPESDAPAGDPSADHPADSSDDLSHLPPPPVGWRPDDSTSSPDHPAPLPDDPAASPDDAVSSGALFEPLPDAPRAPRDDDGGPPTEAHPIINAGTSFGGSHLDELRRAVSADATDAEGDAAMAAFFDQDTDDEPSRRFGRRR